ncbi:MAG: magnesium/cobalt transporter CorA [bacterium]|nr:magnesium/cobalt transporter CorA [bacterium]
MPTTKKHYSRKAGLPPGTLVHVGEQKAEQVLVRVVNYDAEHFQAKDYDSVGECAIWKQYPGITWINVDGLHRTELIETIGSQYGLDPLIQEDIVNTMHRPKLEESGSLIFVQLRALSYREKSSELEDEQISLICGENFVLSFQEKPGDFFEAIRQRIEKAASRQRFLGTDYLFYVLLDTIIDNYFIVLEKIGEKLDKLEGELLANPRPATQRQLHNFKRKLLILRNSVWPLREIIGALERGESTLIKEGTHRYFRDVYDHTVQVIETVETYRDLISGMLETYLSVISNRMNEIMKVLTVIATIFIPLTFLAGVYGMNFKYFPELETPGFYPWGFWGINALISGGMMLYFKRKKWL